MSEALPSLSRLLDDQSSRWSRGRGQPVEVYLSKYPALRSDREALLDLIYQEVVLRSRAGENPQVGEYLQRFPELEEELRAQFEVHAAVASTVSPPPLDSTAEQSRPQVSLLDALLVGLGPGATLGRHVLIEKLGEGGMGAVFKARHTTLERIDAIKVIRPELLHSSKVLDRFYQEARAAARLNHPNIVAVYDAGEDARRHYLVLEFVAGRDLAVILRQKGRFSPSAVCALMAQVALGLQHVHERGLVHRDLKPSNLLLTEGSRQVKILDLGLACLRSGNDEAGDRLTSLRQVLGTPDYMAPEQASEARNVDIRADLYSLGCTAYHLLTGRVPFPGGDLFDKILRHRQEEPTPLHELRPDLAPALEECIRRLMAKNPADRYRTPSELAQEIRALLRDPAGTLAAPSGRQTMTPRSGPATPPPLPAPPTASQPTPNRRRLLLGFGSAALLAGVGATYLAFRGGSSAKIRHPPLPGTTPWQEPAQAPPSSPWTVTATLEPPVPGNVFVALFNPTGTTLAVTCGDHGDALSKPGRVYLVDVVGRTWNLLGEHEQSVAQVAFSPDGHWLASGAGSYSLYERPSGHVILWDLSTRKQRMKIPLFKQDVSTLVSAPDGEHALAVGVLGEFSLIHWKTGSVRQLPPLDPGITTSGRGAFSPDGQLFAIPCSRGLIILRETKDWKVVDTIEFKPYPNRWMGGVRLRAENREVIAAASLQQDLAQPGQLSIWNRGNKNWRHLGEIGAVFAQGIDMAPDQRTVAVGTSMGDLQIWDVVAGVRLEPMPPAHRALLWNVNFSPTGRLLATASNDGTVRLWQPGS